MSCIGIRARTGGRGSVMATARRRSPADHQWSVVAGQAQTCRPGRTRTLKRSRRDDAAGCETGGGSGCPPGAQGGSRDGSASRRGWSRGPARLRRSSRAVGIHSTTSRRCRRLVPDAGGSSGWRRRGAVAAARAEWRGHGGRCPAQPGPAPPAGPGGIRRGARGGAVEVVSADCHHDPGARGPFVDRAAGRGHVDQELERASDAGERPVGTGQLAPGSAGAAVIAESRDLGPGAAVSSSSEHFDRPTSGCASTARTAATAIFAITKVAEYAKGSPHRQGVPPGRQTRAAAHHLRRALRRRHDAYEANVVAYGTLVATRAELPTYDRRHALRDAHGLPHRRRGRQRVQAADRGRRTPTDRVGDQPVRRRGRQPRAALVLHRRVREPADRAVHVRGRQGHAAQRAGDRRVRGQPGARPADRARQQHLRGVRVGRERARAARHHDGAQRDRASRRASRTPPSRSSARCTAPTSSATPPWCSATSW